MTTTPPTLATRPPTGLESLHELSGVLSERVRQGVEGLISASHAAIGRARREGRGYDHKDLYVAGSRIVMRCVITLFAEARGLLPMENRVYRRAFSLETLRERASRDVWPRLIALFRLIHAGSTHARMSVPRYGGALFEPGRADSDDGISRALALLESPDNRIDDQEVMKLLRLLTRVRMRPGRARNGAWIDVPVDFARLSSEYIGVLYEGLLDFELKQAADDDPVIFLAVGNQPAFTLSQLESLSDKTIAQLFDALSKRDTRAIDEVEDDEAPADDIEDDAEAESPAPPQTLNPHHAMRVDAWLARAAALSGVTNGQANTLCARLVAPGEFYLVRWGGTRKGAGTFFTRPSLAEPTVRRTLQPLAYDAVRSEIDARTGLETVVEWTPKTPEQILSIKVCDPAMGSGSFLASALRYLTDALVVSLHRHGMPNALFNDDLVRLDPRDERFEQALRAQLKRHVVEHCLYGVDIDPLAVELGRMALWVETLDRGLPFGFVDHKLKVGNALVGAWFDASRDYPAMAWAREGGDKDYQKDKPGNLGNHAFVDEKGRTRGDVFNEAIKKRARLVTEQLRELLDAPDAAHDTDADRAHDALRDVLSTLHRLPLGECERRARVYRTEWLDSAPYRALKARLDLWCALWFWPGDKIAHAPLPFDFARPNVDAMSIASEVARRHVSASFIGSSNFPMSSRPRIRASMRCWVIRHGKPFSPIRRSSSRITIRFIALTASRKRWRSNSNTSGARRRSSANGSRIGRV
ncbi:hypothetical protein BVER_04280 [Candidatus Burkholderia verschuerenii]|uniref:site-specific DNA-methyltransferase (adenine-specific) n=1 Tax=Candidatus Burkholderia verschuerenii TaxID=242163 RepID=A0A0L0MHB9_9BURK|nr:hypothetical protein [Candidatus Burkholderia verschuerenii]KND61379.1 hypothetical protein BVER_04280 [Candidatus Burkholderia verschuerenii]